MKDKPDGERFVTTREAAEFLGLSEKTLIDWRYRKSKIGPPFHVFGSRRMYSVEDLDCWAAKTRRDYAEDVQP
jgi:hypothetical protein